MQPSTLEEITNHIDETSAISDSYLGQKIRQIGIRGATLLLFYLLLWNLVPWIKWTLLFTIPFVFFGLWQILSIKNRLDRKLAKIRKTIDRIDKMEEQ